MRKRLFTIGAVAAGLLLTACGESGYQYLESDDERVFAKIPDDWQITSEGVVDFALRVEGDTQFRLLPGDDMLPWRAQFTSDPAGRRMPDLPSGSVDVQPIDARLRENMSIERVVDDNPAGDPVGEPIPITLGDLEGYRTRYMGVGENPTMNDQLILTDDRRTVLYVVEVGCRQSCFEANFDEIDEILTTFTVEG